MEHLRLALAGLAAACIQVASEAHACPGPFAERYVLLPAIPEKLEAEQVVLRVSPPAEDATYADGLTLEVREVIQGDWEENEVRLSFPPVSSCSRRLTIKGPVYLVGSPGSDTGWLNVEDYRLSSLGCVAIDD